jgi:hypothetical protein
MRPTPVSFPYTVTPRYSGYLESIIPDMRDELLSESDGYGGGDLSGDNDYDDSDSDGPGGGPGGGGGGGGVRVPGRRDSFLRMSSAYYDTIAGMPSPVQVCVCVCVCVSGGGGGGGFFFFFVCFFVF